MRLTRRTGVRTNVRRNLDLSERHVRYGQLRDLIQNHEGSHHQLASDVLALTEGWGRS